MKQCNLILVALLVGLLGCSTPTNDAPASSEAASAEDAKESADRGDDTVNWTFKTVAEGYEDGALFSGWAGSEATWFVGGEYGQPLVVRRDAEGWSRLDPGTGAQAWWVHGFEDGPVVVVGDAGSIARYEGGSWEQMPTGLPGVTLYGVWGASPDDMWAVGGPYAFSESGPPSQGPVEEGERRADVLLHYDGVSWSQVVLPELPDRSLASQSLFKVWGSAADDVFVVGGGRLILHYDGDSWSVQDAGEGSQQLFTVTGRGPDDVWAVGGGASAVLLRYDGSAWSEVDLPPFTPQVLQGLWTAPGQPVHISGFGGFIARLSDGLWEVSDPVTTNPLHGLVGEPSGALWAAGGTILTASKNYQGTLLVSGASVEPLPTWSMSEEPGDVEEDVEVPSAEDTLAPGPEPVACDAPMTSCPESVLEIFPGGPCEGEALLCSYEVAADWEYWHFSCDEGAWLLAPECLGDGGACGIPPSSEACLDPADAAPMGSTAEIGPASFASAFAPFGAGQQVEIVWGSQGSPMLEFRMQLGGIQDVECVRYQLSAELSAGTQAESSGTVRMRCGESLGMYLILPLEVIDCDTSLFDLHLELSVEGFGTQSYDLVFQGGGGCWG